MSADNGVYILVSRGRKTRHGYRKEYRVVFTQAIENIWNVPDAHDGGLDLNYVSTLFGAARVFTDRKVAEGYALRIEDEYAPYGGTEYGICWFDYSNIPFPNQQRSPRLKLSAVS